MQLTTFLFVRFCLLSWLATNLQVTAQEIKLMPFETMKIWPILSEFPNCSHHIEDLAASVDYSSLELPFSSNASAGKRLNDLHVPKIKSLQCTVTLFTLPIAESFSELAKSNHRLIFPFAAFGRVTEQSSVTNYIILIATETALEKYVDVLTRKLSLRKTYAPLLFIQQYVATTSELGESEVVIHGVFVCWICSTLSDQSLVKNDYVPQIRMKLLDFTCKPGSNCKNAMETAYKDAINDGKNIYWSFRIDFYDYKISYETPFNPTKTDDVTVERAAFGFLQQALNYTLASLDTEWPDAPRVFYLRVFSHFNDDMEVYYTGTQRTFNFITSGGVVPTKSGYTSLLSPFDFSTWICILVSPLALSVLLIRSRRCIFRDIKEPTMFQMLFASYCSLLDQVSIGKSRKRWSTMRTSNLIIYGTWIISALLLTFWYRTAVRLQHVISSTSIQWTKLEQLENFTTLYVPLREDSIVLLEELNRWEHALRPVLFLCEFYREKRIPECDIYDSLRRIAVGPTVKGNAAALHMSALIQFVREEELREMISTKLLEAETAIVVPSDNFGYYWSMFSASMQSNSSLKISHNHNRKDVWAKISSYFQKMPLNSFHDGCIPRRMSVMFSSGIYDLWAKWEKIHLKINPGRWKRTNKRVQPVQPTSLTESGTGAGYAVFLCGIAAGFVIFCAEKLVHWIRAGKMYVRIAPNHSYCIQSE